MTAAVYAPQILAGAVGEQLQRRLEDAAVGARELLGLPYESAPADLAQLRGLIGALREQFTAELSGLPAIEEQEAALERLRQRFEARFEALERVQAAVGELREVTSPRQMLARAPAALCAGSSFERAIVSLVRGGRMIAEAVHFTGAGAAPARAAASVLAQLQASPVRLEHTLIETELLRRRRATIVLDAHVHPRVDRGTAELMGWRSYAAAPLVVGSVVAGVIHADRGPGQPLDVLDRDVLWEFATGLAQAYESTTLRRTLRDERDQMREFLEWLRVRSSELTDAPVTLSAGGHAPVAPPAPLPESSPTGAATRDDRVVFEGLLTRRELDVLRLMAEGATNRQVADALVISSGTVKFHAGSILRKLHAANRAEAVTRYLRLIGMRVP
ncbi:MAG TPA: LuxR C-terminal-related transcriptional regulator [Solirubrobacteraceae bacterium]|nr:LuxR C-terminal-related transcriptional regulator [Solirubrobacteraceae bacterium]